MKERINKLLHGLNKDLFEREEAIKLAFLATLAGESIFLLGPPGVAKSLIARRIKNIFKGGRSFEYLMNRFSTPDEIFGPIAISKLKAEDKYERVTENYLPSSDIVFLDEIWKSGPSIQNALLTVLNEKKFRNGTKEIDIPLKGLISASNELPSKGEGLEALWDRFIIRYIVTNISDPKNFNNYIKKTHIETESKIEEELKISDKEYTDWQKQISDIKISDEALNVINVLRAYIEKHNKKKDCPKPIYISDRRWRKIIRLLQTSAFLNERDEIDLMDCFLITYALWDEVEEIEVAKDFVTDAIKNHGYSSKYNLSEFTKEIEDLKLDINNNTKESRKVTYYEPKSIEKDKTTYYMIEDNGQLKDRYNHHCNYIKESDYKSLIKTGNKRIGLFSSDGNLAKFRDGYNYDMYLVANFQMSNEITITGESGYQNKSLGTFSLSLNKKQKTEVETKTPDHRIVADWNKKVKTISNEIDSVIKDINNYKDTNLKSLKENLFVSIKLANIAEYNLNETINNLVKEKTKLIRLKEGYDKL